MLGNLGLEHILPKSSVEGAGAHLQDTREDGQQCVQRPGEGEALTSARRAGAGSLLGLHSGCLRGTERSGCPALAAGDIRCLLHVTQQKVLRRTCAAPVFSHMHPHLCTPTVHTCASATCVHICLPCTCGHTHAHASITHRRPCHTQAHTQTGTHETLPP